MKCFPSVENEVIPVVNEKDEIIGSTTFREAHKKGILHREAAVYVVNDKNEVLLQQRVDTGLWDHSSCGHFSPNESYIQGAMREFSEELGICLPASQFVELGKIKRRSIRPGRNNYRFTTVYLVRKNIKIGDFNPEKSEVTEVRYFTKSGLKSLIKTNKIGGAAVEFIEKLILPELK